MRQKIWLFLLAICIIGSLTAQDKFTGKEVFVDESGNSITQEIYAKKIKSRFLKPIKYTIDSVPHYRVINRFKFGQLDTEETNQLRQHISMVGNVSLADSEYVIIKYVDTIKSFSDEMKIHIAHSPRSEDEIEKFEHDSIALSRLDVTVNKLEERHIHDHKFNKRIFSRKIKKWDKDLAVCKKRFERKFDSKVLYMTASRDEDSPAFLKTKWIPISKVLQSLFFQPNHDFKYVILKPNGGYLLSDGHLSDNSLYKLMKTDNWEEFQDNLATSKSIRKGVGLFKKDVGVHKNHCF